MSKPSRWTEPEQLLATLRARWDRGLYLKAHAAGEPFVPITLPIKGPTADELLGDPAAVAAWVDRWRKASQPRPGHAGVTIESRVVRSRALGDNEVPARIRLGTFEELAAVLDMKQVVAQLARQIQVTRCELPAAVPWVVAHPLEVVAHSAIWNRALSTARWIVDHDVSDLDIRHLDLPGVDTKFVEQHRTLLGRLLEHALPAQRVDRSSAHFVARFGFRSRPRYVRFRLLAPVPAFPYEVTEMELRADELARVPLPIRTAFVVENKASYLAFPAVPSAIAIFGEGFGVTTLEKVPWLSQRELVYWGDIDTHGFAILHRLRERVPAVRSILMDRDTLLAHREQVVAEPSPTNAALPTLTEHEAALYKDLVEDRYGTAVRLEQERIRFSRVEQALQTWMDAT
jgi:hypothetical protein